MYQKPSSSTSAQSPCTQTPASATSTSPGSARGSLQKPRVMPGHGLRIDQLANLAAHRPAVVVEARRRPCPGIGPLNEQGLIGADRGAAEDAARDLGAAGVVDDRQPALAHVLEVPAPGLRVPGLAGASRGCAATTDRGASTHSVAVRHQGAHRGRRDAEEGDPVPLDELPQAVRLG